VTTRRLPLFPLPLVLLPGTKQALHIFEPRYRRLLADALAGTREFGMILRTPDVAERAIAPATVGCIATIEAAQELEDGRSNIVVAGGDRFALRHFVDDAAPYHVAEVDPFGDDPEPAAWSEDLAIRMRALFERIAVAARAMQDDRTPPPPLPDGAAELSFAIAQHVDLALADKQRLLASPSPSERLRQLDARLSPFVESIEMRAQVHTRARTNGHGAH
jgi:Lon protease-like protein